MAASPQQHGVQSIEVGMQVLTAIERGRGPMPLSRIAVESGLAPSKAHRYLVSLQRTGLVSQEVGTGLYNLGPAARRLGVEALRRVDEVATASPYAAALRDRTGHTVYLAVWTDTGPSLVRQDHGYHPLPLLIRVGSILPITDSSIGHAFMAFLPEPVTRPILLAQQERKETSLRSADELARALDEVRGTRLASVHGSVVAGLNVVSTPVFGPGGTVELVIGVAMPARVDDEQDLARIHAELLATSRAISAELGHTEPA
ncbi:IclR family transcriptional regulator [Prauserella flavalba]|uniref:IclR family transcriptional regulator n=1 Tax=Prauserella flavalba TaxID=1477506 RepID=UPI0036E1AF1E